MSNNPEAPYTGEHANKPSREVYEQRGEETLDVWRSLSIKDDPHFGGGLHTKEFLDYSKSEQGQREQKEIEAAYASAKQKQENIGKGVFTKEDAERLTRERFERAKERIEGFRQDYLANSPSSPEPSIETLDELTKINLENYSGDARGYLEDDIEVLKRWEKEGRFPKERLDEMAKEAIAAANERMKAIEKEKQEELEKEKQEALEEEKQKALEEEKEKEVALEEEVEDIAESPETITEAEARETLEKVKRRPKLKERLKKIVLIALAGLMILGGALAVAKNYQNNNDPNQSTSSGIEQVDDSSAKEAREAHHGIYDGYYESGMFMSEGKGTPYDFANATIVGEALENDECDTMMEVDRCQVESFADHLAGIPDAVKAKYGVPSEFMGLSILETETKLQNLSPAEYDQLQQQMEKIWDDAFTEDVVLNGTYKNAYMRLIDPNKPATHDNVELVVCTTQEHGTKAKRFFWTEDGNGNSARIGDVIAKISKDENGKLVGCTQFVFQEGSEQEKVSYAGMTAITITEITTNHFDTPDKTPDKKPDTPGHPAKNEDAERAYAGEYAKPMEVDWSKTNTEAEHESQEATNRESVEQQESEDAKAATAAAETAREQAAAEAAAAETAAQRRTEQETDYNNLSTEDRAAEDAARAAANEAKAASEASAAEAQQAANAATQQAQQSITYSESAQSQANTTETVSGAPGQAAAANGTLDANDFAQQANQMGF